MGVLLNIETSTKNCSVCISAGDRILSLVEESSDQYIHSEKLHLFIEKALKEANLTMPDLNAVAVGKGPGSYTGLRIGVSAAKGFCFALKIPLISADGLQILVKEFLDSHQLPDGDVIIPMLDARRMEVYCCIHDSDGLRTGEIVSRVIDENSFSEIEAPKIHLIGDGAEKCLEILDPDRFVAHPPKYPGAKALAAIAHQKFKDRQFEDMAYFDPFYLKDFIAGKPKKLL